MGSSVLNPCPVIKVVSLDNAAFLFVPPAPSSTTIKSDVVKSAPISVPPSISILLNGKADITKSKLLGIKYVYGGVDGNTFG